MPTLAVVGAGPKGIAIAAKARAVAAAGLAAPRVVLVERGAVAGNWSGRQGYTSGLLPLGTPAEKDVGFPYADSWGRPRPRSPRRWRAIAGSGTWSRRAPTPTGSIAAGCARRTGSGAITCVRSRRRRRLKSSPVRWPAWRPPDGRWRLALTEGEAIWADGVVFTGAGPPISVPGQPHQHSRVFDGRSYWLAERTLATEVAHSVCVIGNGETAASVVISLLARSHKRSTVDVVTSRGFLYSRGESYEENRFFSDPGDWPHLAEAHRREFLERTDRGVFSAQAEAILNASHGFRTLAGRAVRIEAGQQQVIVTIEYGSERERVAYDVVVVAIGFQARWFEGLLGAQARGRLASALAGDQLDRRIDVDLSVAGLSPPLHLPVVAGLAQGPGFPNLSCLGLLSDRVLRRYVPLESRPWRPP